MDKHLSVVLVSRYPKDPNNPRGGVETATIGLAGALAARSDVDVKVVTLESSISSRQVEDVNGIEVHRLPRSKFPMLPDIFFGPNRRRLRQYLNELNPDIVHFHESWGLGGLTYGRTFVFTFHGFDSLNLATTRPYLWPIRSAFWNFGERYGLSRQHHLISIAPYVTEELEKRTKAKITDIWNALDSAYFQRTREPVGQELVFLGWLNSRKNPLLLVEAAARIVAKFPDLKVYLCGEASDTEYAKRLNQRIDELNLSDTVVLTGRLSQEQVRERLIRASAMVLPSLQENAPMVIAEAMACGVPVIASNLCGIPDMLDHGESGILIDPRSESDLANKLDQFLSDPDRIEQLGNLARESAHRRYHPDSVGSATVAVYRDIINSTPSS